jgi:GNAT superfamily N-acetyltransferase
LPEYQGLGIGSAMLGSVAKHYLEKGFRFTITTSHPGLIRSLKSKKQWRCGHFGRGKKISAKSTIKSFKNLNNRITAWFEYLEV